MCLLIHSNVINTVGCETADESSSFVLYCKALLPGILAGHRLIRQMIVTLLNNVYIKLWIF